MALAARRLSVVVEEDGPGAAENRPHRAEVDLGNRGVWQVPPRSKRDIEVLAYPQRKSPSTVLSGPTAFVEGVQQPGVEDDAISWKGGERVDTDHIVVSKTQPERARDSVHDGKKAGTGGRGAGAGAGAASGNDWTANAERRQLRSFFSRSQSKNAGSSNVPHMLSSRASSDSSSDSDSGKSGTSAISRITASGSRRETSRSFEQRSSVDRTPSTSVEPSYAFPAGFPMEARRKLEVATLQRFEKLSINPNIGEFWMMIDASWVERWVLFVMGNAGPPGPITNRNLYSHVVPAFFDGGGVRSASTRSFFNADGGNTSGLNGIGLEEGLKIGEHYRALHPLAWYILEAFYGTDGAPDICRTKADIYSHPVSVTRKMKVEKDNQTKAVHLVSRAARKVKNKIAAEADRSDRGSSDGSSGGGD